MAATVRQCAEQAKAAGFQYFAIQYYGECWSGTGENKSFSRYGPSNNCWSGVGGEWTNAVYRLQNMPACSSQLPYTVRSSSATSSRVGTWCSAKSDMAPWLEINFDKPTRITGIGIQGKYPNNFVTEFTMEFNEGEGEWTPYREYRTVRVLIGNSEWSDVQIQWLVNPTEGRSFRIKPKTWKPSAGSACMSVRLFGCA
ncbi:inactive carboxypeptidase-like protein X2 isoform X2 [Nematostella vectensis]|nr:inactive carboxypeptidase-like protein X2 isoform X2 [Nematostella vectensis]